MTTVTAPLVGMRHHEGASEALSGMGFGDALTLVREPENPYDENAIQVFTLDSILLGYIAREYASDWAPHFDSDGTPEARLTFGSNGWPRVEIEFGEATEESPEEDEEAPLEEEA
jgi:hypothetical protein